jgi:hypothetical protein
MVPLTISDVVERLSRSGLRLYVDGNFHSKFIVGIAPVAAGERNCLLGGPSHPDPDEVTIADEPVCGIEFYPARARNIDLAPARLEPPLRRTGPSRSGT